MAENISKIYLMNVPLESDYKHTLYFENEEAQQSFFNSQIVNTYHNCSYVRKDHVLRIPAHVDLLMSNNYVMYQNPQMSNKWFYAFIMGMQYVNNNMTHVFIATDVMQTWMFDYTIQESFVEREHVNDDTRGAHLQPENFELGEFICNKLTYAGYGSESVVVMGATKTQTGANIQGSKYHNIYSGVRFYGYFNDNASINALNTKMKAYAEAGVSDAIECLFMAPKELVTFTEAGSDEIAKLTTTPDIQYINNVSGSGSNKALVIDTNLIDGYAPRNKKLLTSPYKYLLLTNNSGSSAILQFENFYVGDGAVKTMIAPSFRISGCLTPGCSVRIDPCSYKGVGVNETEGLPLGKYPTLNWASDYYTNWLTQNALNIPIQQERAQMTIDRGSFEGQMGIVKGALGVASGVLGGAATGGVVGAVTGGLSSAVNSGVSIAESQFYSKQTLNEGRLQQADILSQKYQASLVAPQFQGNAACGDVLTALGVNDFCFYDMSIKQEYALIIDKYFDMYGYQVNQVKIPNKNHRSRYWFTKTVDINLNGSFYQEDLQKIKNIYNNGITFWRNADDINNYSNVNTIV